MSNKIHLYIFERTTLFDIFYHSECYPLIQISHFEDETPLRLLDVIRDGHLLYNNTWFPVISAILENFELWLSGVGEKTWNLLKCKINTYSEFTWSIGKVEFDLMVCFLEDLFKICDDVFARENNQCIALKMI